MSGAKQIRDVVPDVGLRERRLPALIASPVLTWDDAAVYADIPLSTLDAMRAKGQGPPAFTLGRRLRVRQSDFRDWLDRMASEAAA